MSCRRIALWVLVLNLIGFAPSALACATMMAVHEDCCPTGQHSPCVGESSLAPAIHDTNCCIAQPAGSIVNVVLSRKLTDFHPLLLNSLIQSETWLLAPPALIDPAPPRNPTLTPFDGTQTYLRTRRLRL